MTLIGKRAPSFVAPAVIDGEDIKQNFSLNAYLGRQAVLFFFYPKDFTFVCPTELLELQKRSDDFSERNVTIVGCSTDTEETHWAWLHVEEGQGGIAGVKYPLVADSSKTIAANYGVLGGTWYIDEDDEMQFDGLPVAYRGVFLIDEEGIVRHMSINDLSLGRNIDELLRTIDMMRHVDEYGEVCPVNWHAGAKAFEPTAQGLATYLQERPFRQKDGQCGCMCGKGKRCQNCQCRSKEPTSAHIQCSQCGCEKGNCRCEPRNSV
ncbi:MAG: peroxiredoxin [Bacteroidota bacterium]